LFFLPACALRTGRAPLFAKFAPALVSARVRLFFVVEPVKEAAKLPPVFLAVKFAGVILKSWEFSLHRIPRPLDGFASVMFGN
jgi:hypothetical protein